jgi:hypothetical protein
MQSATKLIDRQTYSAKPSQSNKKIEDLKQSEYYRFYLDNAQKAIDLMIREKKASLV